MKIRDVLIEIGNNRKRILNLALYEVTAANKETYFGFLWNILSPAMQIFVYWFVFSFGLHVEPVDSAIPYVVWLTCGLLPWMFINQSIVKGTDSFYSNAGILKTMHFPLSVIPVKAVTVAALNHLFTMAVFIPFVYLTGVNPSPANLGLFYYIFASFVFLCGFSLIGSSVNAVFPDFQRFLSPALRFIFYLSSVVWPIERLPEQYLVFFRLNPLVYLIDGYRNCMLYHGANSGTLLETVYFWCFTGAVWVMGTLLHVRFRSKFIDVI